MTKKAREKRPADQPESEKLKEFEQKLEDIANKPRDSRDQLRQRLAEMQKLEEQIKERGKQQMDKSRSVKNQLQQLDQQAQKSKDGPTKDLEKALAQGDFNKAKEELDKLTEKMKKQRADREGQGADEGPARQDAKEPRTPGPEQGQGGRTPEARPRRQA
jgi:hypothetical protein